MANPDERQQRVEEIRAARRDRMPGWKEVLWLCTQVTDLQQQLEAAQEREREQEDEMEHAIQRAVDLATIAQRKDHELEQARQLLERWPIRYEYLEKRNMDYDSELPADTGRFLTPPTPEETVG